MTDPRIQARRVRVERQRGHRRLGILLGVLAAGGLSAGARRRPALVAVRCAEASSSQGRVHTPRSEILAGERALTRAPAHRRQPGPGGAAPRAPALGAHGLGERRVALDASRSPSSSGCPVATSRTRLAAATPCSTRRGRVLADESLAAGSASPSSARSGRPAPGARSEPPGTALSAAAAQLPVSLLPRVKEIVRHLLDGVVLHLNGGLRRSWATTRRSPRSSSRSRPCSAGQSERTSAPSTCGSRPPRS